MYYTIYKITNIINQKYYTGKHITNNLNDGYMGSGKLIRAAIKKYGITNFQKEILHIFENEQDMNDMEAKIVVIGENSYNLCEGGHGGFGFINRHGLNWNPEKNKAISGFKNLSPEARLAYCKKGGAAARDKTIQRNKAQKGITKPTPQLQTDEAIQKRAATLRVMGHQKGEKNSQFGKPKSEETRNKIRMSRIGKEPPPNLKGYRWWTNEVMNKRAIECPGPEWRLGTKTKI